MKAVLFDMDGTLLPLDVEDLIRYYFGGLIRYAAPLGFAQEPLMAMMKQGVKAMIKNDGSVTNADRFWAAMSEHFPEWNGDKHLFDAFYETGYREIAAHVTANPYAAKSIQALKEKGYRLIVATNPLFPETAQVQRLAWAGLDPADFEWITHFENSHYSKPNPAYYREILQGRGLSPDECLMIGNDVEEDMEAGRAAGLSTWLLTDLIINRKERDIDAYPHGDFAALYDMICALPNAE